VRGKRPVPRSISGDLDHSRDERKIFHLWRVPVMARPGFSFTRKIIFRATATKTATHPK
jgi:hypothetical protein